ncbi:MAG TPA: carboxypeptidase-like regulatory domain-containing protein [Ferruginibacter sp.]|nr:carboxypeptidase-like regulatory domain-containing protein [Ferruginibacter sp.]
MKKFSLLLTAMLLSFLPYAQNKAGKISGNITNADKKPLESATIQLLKADNKALVKTAITDKAGNYAFEKIAEGKYIISINAVGFAKKISDAVDITAAKPAVEMVAIELTNQSKALGEVTVVATRPFIEQKLDRTVVNVEASPSNAGATALEVLENLRVLVLIMTAT